MKTLFYLFFIVSGLTSLVQESLSANYYFSQELGDDARSYAAAQNPNTPWKSIDKLNEIFISLKPGDQVLFRRGEKFFGSININQSGQAGNPIILGAYGEGKKPVITSMVEVKNWEAKGNNLYEAQVDGVSGDLSVLTIAEIPYAMGRYPNLSEENAGYLAIDSHNGENMVSTGNLNTSTNFTGGEIVIRKNRWVIDRHPITFHSASSFQYDSQGSDYKPQKNYGFFIQNHPGTLDELGEWHFDPSSKKLLLYYPDGSPSLAQVRTATLDLLVNIRYQISYIEIKELVFEGSNQNSIELESTENISISDCEIRYTGKNAVHTIASPHFTLKNSIVQHSYNGGIFLQWKDNNAIISNNLIEHTFMFAGMGRSGDVNAVIFMGGDSHDGLIEKNRIINSGYLGIYFGGNNTIVTNNFLDTFCFLKDDGAGIYTWTGPSKTKNTNRKVINNIILNGMGANDGTNQSNPLDKGAAEGIYIDDNATGVEISGNSVANMANSGIYIHNANDIKIYNNRVYNAKQSLWMVHDNLGEPIRNLLVNGNRFLAKYRNQKLIRVNSKANDIPEMGQFENNVYAHPLNQIDPITVHLKNASGEVIWKEFDLGSWKDNYQLDLNSKRSPMEIPGFEIKSITGADKVQNGDFEAPLNGPYCWSPDNNCNIQIEENDSLEGKVLKMNLPSPGIVAFSIGEVLKGKTYHFTFSGIGSKNGLVKTYLRQSQSPYQVISDTHTLKVSPNKSEVSVLFTNQANEENAIVILETMDAQNFFWVDNLALQEVEAEMTDPEAYILFEYNDSAQPKVISVPGTYVDLDNNLFSGTITLDPFSSIFLIKKSDQIPQEAVPEPISKIEWLSPDSHTIMHEGDSLNLKVAVEKGKIGDVEKINYYFGKTLISTESEDPFSCTWKDLPYGNHYLHVEAFDKYGRVITSDSTLVEVRKPNVAPVINQDTPTKDTHILEGESLSIKGSALDLDGEIALIEFFANNERIGSTNQNTYDFTWNAIPAGNYALSVRVIDNEGLEIISTPIQLTVDPSKQLPSDEIIPSEGYTLLVNMGSRDEVNWASQTFSGDPAITGYIEGNTSTFFSANSIREPLFQTERFGKAFTIAVPLPNGTYTVKTYHNELWFGYRGPKASSGQRVFDISLQQEIVKEKFDLFEENRNQPMVLTFRQIKVSNGILELGMKAHANNASINGLAIIQEKEAEAPVGMVPEITQPDLRPVLRLKTGYGEDVAHGSATYESDFKFKGYYGKSYIYRNPQASEQELFQSERNGVVLNYAIPIPNGNYTVKTYHHELYFGQSGPDARAGRRVFDISLEGARVKKGFDLFVENNNQPTVLTFKQITVKDGVLNLDMVATANRATISAISIYENLGTENQIPEADHNFFLNTGGKTDEPYMGYTFTSEVHAGGTFHNPNSWIYSNSHAAEDKLFQTERNAENLSYRIPVPNGTYTVYTIHNELYFGHSGPSARAGRRVFDIRIEGETVKEDFDMFVENRNQATALDFKNIEVTDGFLDLEMSASQNRASVSGIAIMGNSKDNAIHEIKGANLRGYREMDHSRGYREMEIGEIQKGFPNEEILIYPNPARENVFVEMNMDVTEGKILIHNMGGQLISHFDLNWLSAENNRYTLPLGSISPGIYLITVSDELEVIKRQRIIVTP